MKFISLSALLLLSSSVFASSIPQSHEIAEREPLLASSDSEYLDPRDYSILEKRKGGGGGKGGGGSSGSSSGGRSGGSSSSGSGGRSPSSYSFRYSLFILTQLTLN